MLGALADFPSCPPPGQRSSQCECFTLCLLSTAGLVGSRKLLSSSSSACELAVRMTGSSTGADRRAQESVTPSHWTSRGRSSWRAHARMVSLRSDKWVFALWECCRPNFVDKVAMPGMWRDAHSSTAGCSRVPQIPAGSVTDGLHSPPNGPSQQTAAEGKTRIKALKQMLKSAREPQDHGCTSTRSKSKQRGTPSWRVPGQRAGWTRMGQGFAPSRSPGDGNSTGQSCCHPNPAPRSRTEDGTHCSGHGAAEPRRHGDTTVPAKHGCTSGFGRADRTSHGGGRISWHRVDRQAPLWIVRCGTEVLHLEWHLSPLHRRLALAHQFHNSSGSNNRNSR